MNIKIDLFLIFGFFFFADELKSNANLYFLLRESKWVLLCFVLFGIMLFLLSIAHIVLSIIQCRSENRI